MAQYHQSWLNKSALSWFGYLLTALAALPASYLGWVLFHTGLSRLSSILISIAIALFVGFLAEAIVYWYTRNDVEIGQIRVVIVTTTTLVPMPDSKPTSAVNNALIRLA